MSDEDIYSMSWGEFTENESRKKDEERARTEEAADDRRREDLYRQDVNERHEYYDHTVKETKAVKDDLYELEKLRKSNDRIYMPYARRRSIFKKGDLYLERGMFDNSDVIDIPKSIGNYEEAVKHSERVERNADAIANGGCFITTAVCSSLGLGDNCQILQTLRYFRDTFMMATARRRELVKHYYKHAPGIVRTIDKRKDVKEVYRNLLFTFILPCYRKILEGNNMAALNLYSKCFIFLEKIRNETIRKGGV